MKKQQQLKLRIVITLNGEEADLLNRASLVTSHPEALIENGDQPSAFHRAWFVRKAIAATSRAAIRMKGLPLPLGVDLRFKDEGDRLMTPVPRPDPAKVEMKPMERARPNNVIELFNQTRTA